MAPRDYHPFSRQRGLTSVGGRELIRTGDVDAIAQAVPRAVIFSTTLIFPISFDGVESGKRTAVPHALGDTPIQQLSNEDVFLGQLPYLSRNDPVPACTIWRGRVGMRSPETPALGSPPTRAPLNSLAGSAVLATA